VSPFNMQNNDKKDTFFNLFPNNQQQNQRFSLGTGNKDNNTGLFTNTGSFGGAQGGTSGGLFGTGPGFGSQTNTGTGFMNNQGPMPSTNVGQTGGLFTAPATGSSGIGGPGSFGLSNAANTSGSLFGNTGTGAGQTTGGLFGTQAANTGTGTGQTTGGLFGTQAANAGTGTGQTTGGLFGTQTANQSAGTSSGLNTGPFSMPQTNTQQQSTAGLFSTPNQNDAGTTLFKTQPSVGTTNLFSAQPQATVPGGSLFGSTPQNTAGAASFGAQQGVAPYNTQGIAGTTISGPAQPATASSITGTMGGQTIGNVAQQPATSGPFGVAAPQPISTYGETTTKPGTIGASFPESKDSSAANAAFTNVFSPAKPVVTQPNTKQETSAIAQPSVNVPASTTSEAVDGNSYVDITSVPLNFRQKSFNEILTEISAELEKDVKFFKKKAEEVFAQDEKIIRARNTYVKLLDRLKAEEDKINELEENVEFLFKWLESMKIDDSVKYLNELEQCYDEFMDGVMQQKNIEDEIAGIINENMKLISIIDEDLEYMESMK
ncbi:Nuclear pore complex, Nup98 component (sc Nup145/Nup100/Nup116), partial [Trachipleistophora hominis]